MAANLDPKIVAARVQALDSALVAVEGVVAKNAGPESLDELGAALSTPLASLHGAAQALLDDLGGGRDAS